MKHFFNATKIRDYVVRLKQIIGIQLFKRKYTIICLIDFFGKKFKKKETVK